MANPTVRVFRFQADTSGERLDKFMARKTSESRAFFQKQIRRGEVRVNGDSVVRPSHLLKKGEEVEGSFQVEEYPLTPIAGELDILYEDKDLIAINKPQGLVVHPAPGMQSATLAHHLLYHFRNHPSYSELSSERPGIVHRLDRGTSGVIVVAKNRRTHESLSSQFKSRSVTKEYESIVWGRISPRGSITNFIGRHPNIRKKMSSRAFKGREAITHFQALWTSRHFSFIQLFPKTGRTHQLRVHLSENGNPIVGDPTYTHRSLKHKTRELAPVLQASLEEIQYPYLHAKRLMIAHPSTAAPLTLEAPLPKSFEVFLKLIQNFDS